LSSPRHPNDANPKSSPESEGVPKLHAQEFTVPPGWYERSKARPSSDPPAEPPPAEESGRPPSSGRGARAEPLVVEPAVVLATDIVASAHYESAPRIDSVPSERAGPGPAFLDSALPDTLKTDLDVTTPFNAEVRELQALATQPSLRARQRQAAKRRLLMLGVLFVLFCASAVLVVSLVSKNKPSPSGAHETLASPHGPAKPRMKPSEHAVQPASPHSRVQAAAPAAAAAPPSRLVRRTSAPVPSSTTSTEPKSKLITRTPTF